MSASVQHRTSNLPQSVSEAFEDVLAQSLSADSFVDVAFYAYSKRSQTGRVHGVQQILANSTVLKASSTYLRGLLSGGFTESVGEEGRASQLGQTSDTYDYESDSDLEDDDGSDEAVKLSTPSTSGSAILEKAGTSRVGGTATDSRLQVVPMKSVAASTLKSLIFYIYTGKAFFLPLTSCGARNREKALAEHTRNHPGIPICASKSLYCIADEMGLEDLRKVAEDNIRTQLGQENILEEILSQFSSKYSTILDMQIRVLRTKGLDQSASFEAAFREKMDTIVKGGLPHASTALVSLVCTTYCPSPCSPSPRVAESSVLDWGAPAQETADVSDVSGVARPFNSFRGRGFPRGGMRRPN